MVEHLLMMQWVIRSIPLGRPNELFLIPAGSGIIKTVVSCLWVGAYKTSLAPNQEEWHQWVFSLPF